MSGWRAPRLADARPLAALCLLALAACTAAGRAEPTIRVLVFNIHAGKDGNGAPNLDGVAELIRTSRADVVLLQEVDRGTRRSGGVDQLLVLAERTDYGGVFGRSLEYDGGQYGIAALSRDRIVADRTESLTVASTQPRAGGSFEPRVALLFTARTPLGPVQVLNTHLDASPGERDRLQESAHIVSLVRLRAWRGAPVVVGGDFNAEPGSDTYRQLVAGGLTDAWKACGTGDGFTYPADEPTRRIDYLFLGDGLRCTQAVVIDSRVSDHRPLLVTLAR